MKLPSNVYELCLCSAKLNNLCLWNNFKYSKHIRQTSFSWASLSSSNYFILWSSSPPAFSLSQHQSFIMSLFFASGGHKYRSFSINPSQITADDDCSHDIKRWLLLGRKAMTSLDSILKSRDITLPTRLHLVKAMVFPAVIYGYQSWTINKAEHWRSDAFELWCCRRSWESLGQQGDPTSLS